MIRKEFVYAITENEIMMLTYRHLLFESSLKQWGIRLQEGAF